MGRLDVLYDLTNHMIIELNKLEDQEADRDELILNIDLLIQKREEMLQQIKKPYTKEEVHIGIKIVSQNEEIKEKMNVLYEEIKTDMKQVQQRKEQNYSYLNPYGNVKTTDGMYLDSKL